MTRPAVILGAGGFAREVADIFRAGGAADDVELLGYIDIDDSHRGDDLNGYPILGTLDTLVRPSGLCGIAGAGEIEPRTRQVAEMERHGVTPLTVVHPSVIMSPFVEIGLGTVIAAGVIMTNSIRIGNHVVLNLGVTVGHDSTIGNQCVLCPGVHVSGWVTLEDECYIGTGAVLLPRVTVGRGATVGAGAVVSHDVAPGTTVAGIPARILNVVNEP